MKPKHQAQQCTQVELQKYWEQWAKGQFVGYIWMSNAPLHYVMTSPAALPAWTALHQNQGFIWEANLYQQDKLSITIRQVNDGWLVSQVTWQSAPAKAAGEFLEHRYLGRGMSNDQMLTVREAWQPEPDPLCEGMAVLTPAWTAFVGFSKKEN